MRLDPSLVGGVNANQVTMAVIASGAILVLVIRHRRKDLGDKKTTPIVENEKPGD